MSTQAKVKFTMQLGDGNIPEALNNSHLILREKDFFKKPEKGIKLTSTSVIGNCHYYEYQQVTHCRMCFEKVVSSYNRYCFQFYNSLPFLSHSRKHIEGSKQE